MEIMRKIFADLPNDRDRSVALYQELMRYSSYIRGYATLTQKVIEDTNDDRIIKEYIDIILKSSVDIEELAAAFIDYYDQKS